MGSGLASAVCSRDLLGGKGREERVKKLELTRGGRRKRTHYSIGNGDW